MANHEFAHQYLLPDIRERRITTPESPLITSLLKLIENKGGENKVVDLAEVLSHDQNMLQNFGGAVEVTCKSYTGLARLDKKFFENPSSEGAYGSVKSARPDRGGFAAIPSNDPDLAAGSVNTQSLERNTLMPDIDLIAPRDWLEIGSKLYVVTHNGLVMYDRTSGENRSVDIPLIKSPHAIIELMDGRLCIAASGTDHIVTLDPETLEITNAVSAWDIGMQTSLGNLDEDGKPLKRINAFTDRPLNPNLQRLVDCHGFKLHEYDRNAAFEEDNLTTSLQSAHFNSLAQHPQGPILATVFATSEFDPETGDRIKKKGTGGKIIAIDENNYATDLVTGLTNPHSLVSLGAQDGYNYYTVADTGRGAIQMYRESIFNPFNWELAGEFSIVNLPQERFRQTEWLQNVYPSEDTLTGTQFLTLVDSSRRGFYVINLSDKSYSFISTGNTGVFHKAVYRPDQAI